MATVSAARDPKVPAPARLSSVVLLLRLEGVAVAAVSAQLYARTGASWWLFAAVWLAPDLSLLGYLASPCSGARVYNAYHNYVPPIALAFGALLLRTHGWLLPIALIWINHIAVDRALGLGLKYGEGFRWTHLGKLGRERG
jgi:Domain of unknown function (DUF4260)